MQTILLKGGFAVTPKAVKRIDIALRNGKIELAGKKDRYDKVIDITGKYVIPGLVDIHFHGYELFDFTFGLFNQKTNTYETSPDIYEDCFNKLRSKLAEFGVTGFYLGSITAPIETLRHCYNCLTNYINSPNDTAVGARLLGGLLEGPFINPAKAGAMTAELILEPSPKTFDSIEDGGAIKLANVVPDYGRKSCELTQYLTKKGVIVGAGHTTATCNQVADAVKAGLKYCIHFTNQTDGIYKPFDNGGAIEAVLKFDELYAELIADGFHINPAYVRDIIKRKGVDKIIGITDCMFVAGSSLKQIEVGGVRGRVSDDGNYIAVEGVKNTLFGSNLTMNRAFENMLNWLTTGMEGIWNRRHEALGLEDALLAVAKIYSTNPNQLTGRYDEGFGRIADGAKADLTVLDISGQPGSHKLTVEKTILNGNIAYTV